MSASLSWHSTRDGYLGSGSDLSLYNLSIGDHTITASVSDSLGSPGSSSIMISVNSPPQAYVQITEILYNPVGDDVQGEYVQLVNNGGSTADMTDWTLRDAANHVFTFPAFNLAPDATVRVWTKSGSNSGTDLYWGSGAAIWNNTGDTATLQTAGGQTVDTCTYGGGGSSASCN